jgi:hypothetical protein
MASWIDRVSYGLSTFVGVVHFYNRSVVKCNIKILQEELETSKNKPALKEALLKQRLYGGRLVYLLPPPRFDIELLIKD